MDISIAILLFAIIDGLVFYSFRIKLIELKNGFNNHHQFLLKVKNDIPILHRRVNELEDQILPPEENELH